MFRTKKTIFILAGGVLLLALGALVLVPGNAASALGALFHGGPGGFQGHGGASHDTYLAEALGITVEELQTAQTAAWDAAVDQALEQGLITEAQATRLKAGDAGFRGHSGGMLGWLTGSEDTIDVDALLAKELGISVDELSAARDEAFELRVQAGLDSGELTEHQASLIQARHALKATIDHETMLATALGISTADLQAARDEGKTVSNLITELGLTADEVQANMQAAYEAAVQKAVDDGLITADQAALLLQAPGHMGDFGMHDFHGGHGH
jgi:ribosomal protein S20